MGERRKNGLRRQFERKEIETCDQFNVERRKEKEVKEIVHSNFC